MVRFASPRGCALALGLLIGGGATAREVQPPHACEVMRENKRFKVYFQAVEIEKLVQTVADATCRTFIVPDNLKGKISIIGPEGGDGEIDADRFYAAFLAALDPNGLTVIRSGRFSRIIEKGKAGRSAVETSLGTDPFPTTEEMVTRLFKLKSAELEPVRAVLAQLITQGGELVTYAPDTLIVTDLGTNLHRLERLLKQLDVAPASDELRVLTVQFASAPELSERIQRVLDRTKSPGRPGPGALVFADERTNKLVVLASPQVFDRVEALLRELDIALPGVGQVNVYALKNAEAKDVAATLEGLVQAAHPRAGAPGVATGGALFSGEVKVSVNEAINALVVVANPADFRSVARVIEELDIPRRQIFIETAILVVDMSHGSELGLSGHGVAQVNTGKGTLPVVLGTNYPGEASSLSLKNLLGLSGILAGLQGPTLTNLSTALGVQIPEFGLIVHALETNSNVDVISTPHILAMDNKEAEINVGQRVPFQTGVAPGALQAAGVTPAVSSLSQLYAPITREKVELKLTVKPHIGSGDEVRLEIDEHTEEITSTDKVLGPTTATRGEKTTVVGHDHHTIVLGGIMQDRVIDTVSKIPFLGDLPILGHLFRSTQQQKVKTNLLLILTPHIIRTRADFEAIYERKVTERRKFVEQLWGNPAAGEPEVDFAHKRGPLAALAAAIQTEENRPENGGRGNPGEKVIAPEATAPQIKK